MKLRKLLVRAHIWRRDDAVRLIIALCVLLLTALAVKADDQKPFPNTSLAFHVGTGSNVGAGNSRVIPEADLAIAMSKLDVAGFKTYSYTSLQVLGVQGNPLQLQTEILTGFAEVRPLGEYFYHGPVGALGVTKDALATGMGGKFGYVGGYRLGKSQHWAAEAVVSGEYSSLNQGHKPQLTLNACVGVRYAFNRK